MMNLFFGESSNVDESQLKHDLYFLVGLLLLFSSVKLFV